MSMQSQDKFKNLVLYVLSHGDYKEGGIKKLNKLLYFIDFYFYRDHERLISGVSYAKADMGPIVDDYRVVFDELEQKGFLEPIEDTERPTLLNSIRKRSTTSAEFLIDTANSRARNWRGSPINSNHGS
ncbi:MAG: hypothetical protein UY82_C0038G0023 [Candidatus Uhrbacteria bacterium GW2011_GWC2_53_7]|uniref:Antitoxin SocA-like Panacea domain-containing protein n=1 Tax=Candidatus Uhrbacteria bacterium GW2011_GWC2_53_7 TaxID=1618986 RepID=A0A0G1XX07_9BACT|nr:MAG: hypothetical protein UY82_C0038G0023 [Candidatus Uhrbacteria bacterium GW2011_GWC2_53_7]